MTVEQKAEEIADKTLCETMMCYNHCDFYSSEPHKCKDWYRCYECAKAGAEFGYRKCEKEWQEKADYLKGKKEVDSDSPKNI